MVGGQSDGIPAPQKMLFPGNKLTLKWERVYRVGAGLHNLGNTCFLNSTVQCLTYTPPLANYLLSKEHSRTCEYSSGPPPGSSPQAPAAAVGCTHVLLNVTVEYMWKQLEVKFRNSCSALAHVQTPKDSEAPKTNHEPSRVIQIDSGHLKRHFSIIVPNQLIHSIIYSKIREHFNWLQHPAFLFFCCNKTEFKWSALLLPQSRADCA